VGEETSPMNMSSVWDHGATNLRSLFQSPPALSHAVWEQVLRTNQQRRQSEREGRDGVINERECERVGERERERERERESVCVCVCVCDEACSWVLWCTWLRIVPLVAEQE